jgi:hypothetical protein
MAPRRIRRCGGVFASSPRAAKRDLDLLGVDREHDCRHQAVAVRMLRKQVIEVVFGHRARQLDVALRPAIAVLAVVLEHAPAQGGIRGFLIGFPDGRVHPEAAGVDLFGILIGERLPHHFGRELGMDGVFVRFPARPYRSLEGFVVLRSGDVAELRHPPQDILLALLGPLRICDGVIEGRRFRQTGEHGRLGERQLIGRLAEIDLRGGTEAVGALTEVNLVEIQLENLLLVEAVLDLEGE